MGLTWSSSRDKILWDLLNLGREYTNNFVFSGFKTYITRTSKSQNI